jgi:hypothetical protein
MNDDEVLTAVRHSLTAARDSVADVRMDRPAATILRRARRRRLRRGLAVAAAAAGAAALALAVTLPGGHARPGGPPASRLAAWSVTGRPGGLVAVTVRQLRDPAGLQRTLRADGVPATVRFGNNSNPPDCLYYPFSPARGYKLQARVFPDQDDGSNAFTVDPAAIPAGVGVWITVSAVVDKSLPNGLSTESFGIGWTFVYASGQCPAR